MAQYPAISMVIVAIRSKVGQNQAVFIRKGEKRISKNTPAVTRVEEWTNALTGVGAAMAAGSHLENGSCALLVMAAIMIAIDSREFILESHMEMIDQWPWFRDHPMLSRRKASPTRLDRTVIIPAPSDLGFW